MQFLMRCARFASPRGFPTRLDTRRMRLRRNTNAPTPSLWAVVVGLSTTRSTLLSAVGSFVHRRPGAALGFSLGLSSFFVTFLDVFRLTLLLVGVFGLVSSWHGISKQISSPVNIRRSPATTTAPTRMLSSIPRIADLGE